MKIFYAARIPSWYLKFTIVTLVMAFFFDMLPNLGLNQKNALAPIFQGNPESAKIAFACNVFWGEEVIPEMLQILATHQVKITFFIGGSWAKRNPGALRMIAEAGHELGNHTFTHPHPSQLNKEQNQAEILRTEQLVKEITGLKTCLYAPPYGEYNQTVILAASELSYPTIMWTVDTIDWRRPSPEVIIKRVTSKLQNGAIVLMHPTAPTVKALPELIRIIKSKGYTITNVSDIL